MATKRRRKDRVVEQRRPRVTEQARFDEWARQQGQEGEELPYPRVRSLSPVTLVGELTEWLIAHELWGDAQFRPVSGSPRAVALVTEGPLYGLVNGHYPEAGPLLEAFGEFLYDRGWFWDLASSWKILLEQR